MHYQGVWVIPGTVCQYISTFAGHGKRDLASEDRNLEFCLPLKNNFNKLQVPRRTFRTLFKR